MQYSRMPKISAHTNTELGAALRHRTTELGAAPRHSLDVASQILFCLIELKVRSLRGLFEYTKSYHYEGCRISNVLLGTTTKCVLRGDPLAAGFRAVGPPELEAMRYRRAAAHPLPFGTPRLADRQRRAAARLEWPTGARDAG